MKAPRQDVKALQAEFSRTYQLAHVPLLRDIERRVLGSDYAATSWTTREEAEAIAARLSLAPGVQLLDVGAGCGWPALHLSRLTGCDALLADLPVEALRVAKERAFRDGIGERCKVTAASGAKLPLPDACVDAVTHSDVLCCLPDKLETLCECRRVGRRHAQMVFSVISLRERLCESDRAAALQGAPGFVDAPAPYEVLIELSGWQLSEPIDMTPAFGRSLHTLVSATEEFADGLVQIYGAADYADRLAKRRAALAAAERGWMKRELFVCVV